ncbi:hypothetical protein CR513_61190, partial [Mucuna pruriens]
MEGYQSNRHKRRKRKRWSIQREANHVCGKVGHTIVNCFYRYDESYVGPYTNENKNSILYFDNGASHHVTCINLINSKISMIHDGKNSLMVGNCEKLNIRADYITYINIYIQG